MIGEYRRRRVNPMVDAPVGRRVEPKTNPEVNSRSDARARARRQSSAMTIIDYLISSALVLLVIPQILGAKMTWISVARPVVLVGAASAYYLRGVPTQGHDVLLESLAC